MKKNYKFFTLLTIISLSAYNCAINVGNSFFNSGTVITSVKFPDKNFRIKTIPLETESIIVKVEGEGLKVNEPIFFQLDRKNDRKTLESVPIGNKKINAKAYDKEGNLLAVGENRINVLSNKINRAEVNLLVLNRSNNLVFDTLPVPVNVPTKVPCFVKLNSADLPISKTLEKAITDSGCTIEFPKDTPSSAPPTSATPSNTSSNSSSSSGSSSGGGGGSGIPLNKGDSSIKATVNVIDGPDISNGPITISP